MIIKPPLLVLDSIDSISWDDWLHDTESKLKELGYRKYSQHRKHEDFCYHRIYTENGSEIYQIGILFYDFRKYSGQDPISNRIGIMYECMLMSADRIDMYVSKNVDLVTFENMAKTFYESMQPYYS
jgi:hypothetical protein